MSDLRRTIRALMPEIQTDLERLVRIPSCGFPGFDPAPVRESAMLTADLLEAAGLMDVRIIEVPGGHPAVFGSTPGPAGAPTVLLYAHHDVQPPGPADEWTTPPYEPVVRDGRMYGRGTSDDKCGIAMHLASLRAFGGNPPVGVKVLVEGEEECTAEHLDWLIGEHADLLRADAVIVADAGSWERGTPALTTSIRGVVACEVEVRVAEQALHSGEYGVVPDAITSLARMIAALHDEEGNVAVPGLLRREGSAPVEVSEDDLRAEAKVGANVQLIGTGTLADRMWFGPTISVIGIDAPSIRDASFQIVPVAKAAVTMRIAPGEDPATALQALIDHLRAAAPWGVDVAFGGEERAVGHQVPNEGPIFEAARRAATEAWGVEPVITGSGGSVPLVPILAGVMPDTVILMTGPGDQWSGAHSIDESIDLVELERACLAQALFLENLGSDS
ncbi:MAG: M20/M25/M40 family metallo-hydrolase [Actinomycetota bacterium]